MQVNNQLYQENTKKAMDMLAKEGYYFIGQTCEYAGSPMFGSLVDVPKKQKKEMPVFENTQMGISIGMNLLGLKVCSIFPRIDFLICAVDQLVNHLDKIKEMTHDEFTAGIIIRTQIGSKYPINGGVQHTGDYTKGLQAMLKNVKVIKIKNEKEVIPSYTEAMKRAIDGKSTLIVEVPTGAFGGKR